ncbi:autotransporter outer membrane beta-barrel domain-containing protein [Kluyvera genomosp. 2]|uniref:autotransporter outer membrane beta-barrel domain-containing protein n=1 Tax=Kluyvera genomosp. 2 TaxID=2774054 RepID=UPI003B3AE0B5
MNNTKRYIDKKTFFKRTALSIAVALISVGSHIPVAYSDSVLDYDNVLYFYGGTPLSSYDTVNITVSGSGTVQPLAGFGAYLQTNGANTYLLNNVTISTTGSAADAIRGNSEAIYFRAKNLTITTTGSSADGINVASDFNNNYDSLVYVTESANISVKDGVAVRANNFQNAGANSIIILAGSNVIKVTGTGSASNTSDSKGYAVYAGNRNTDTNGIGIMDILKGKNNNTLGNSYVFIGKNSEISTATSAGHAVYANKGGLIQLGDGVDISTTGANAYAIYASTEQQGTYTDNVRPGSVYLEGGAKLRAANSANVIQAKGVGSIISSQSLAVPVIADDYNRLDRLNIDRTALSDTEGVFDIEGNIDATSGGTVALNMSDTSRFLGSSSVDAASTVNLNIMGSDSLWTMTKDSTLTNLTLDSATLLFQAPGSGDPLTPKTLTVYGNYVGNGGLLVLNTVLGDDNSLTDKLIVQGDTSGTTRVAINNAGGSGDKTITGIEVIHVDGLSDGEFVQSGRIVAGSYDYALQRGEGTQSANWYLLNAAAPIVEPEPTPDPAAEVPIVNPEQPTMRPESGAYIANLAAANSMFNTRLHDRLGDTQYIDRLTGEEKVTSMWLRNIGGHTRFKDSSGQSSTQSNRYVLQLGGDIAQWSTNGLDRWHLGLMAGYGNSQSNTRSNVTRYHSRGQVTGYSVGLYGTWYANEADKTGTYVDTWFLYNWFNNKVYGQQLATEKYDSDGITASIEGGYSYLMGERSDGRSTYWIQPKAQLTWMDVQADTHTEANGTRVKGKNDGNLQTRLGVKAFIKGHNAIDDGKNREFQPFVEANWIYNSQSYGVAMNGVYNYQAGTRNIGELKAGVEGQLGNNLHIWGNVAQQIGDKGYSDTQGMLGIKYAF